MLSNVVSRKYNFGVHLDINQPWKFFFLIEGDFVILERNLIGVWSDGTVSKIL